VNRQKPWKEVGVDWSIKPKSFGKLFEYSNKVNDTEAKDKAVDDFYFKPLGPKWIRKDNGTTMFKALGHRNYFQGTRHTAINHAKLHDNVFLYYFTYFRGPTFLEYWLRGFKVRYSKCDLYISKQFKSTVIVEPVSSGGKLSTECSVFSNFRHEFQI